MQVDIDYIIDVLKENDLDEFTESLKEVEEEINELKTENSELKDLARKCKRYFYNSENSSKKEVRELIGELSEKIDEGVQNDS